MNYYLSLGSNMGDREANLLAGVGHLAKLGAVCEISSVYETEPEGMPEGTNAFLNMALLFQSGLSPWELLIKTKGIERQLGREMLFSHYQPRTLDIDILMADDMVINEPGLIIPHPRMHRRVFVLAPLAEIAPQVIHPVLLKSASCLLCELEMAPPPVFSRWSPAQRGSLGGVVKMGD